MFMAWSPMRSKSVTVWSHWETQRLSASLVTVEFSAEGEATFMRMTEQLAYFDGHDDLEDRIHGTREGIERLALEVEAAGAH